MAGKVQVFIDEPSDSAVLVHGSDSGGPFVGNAVTIGARHRNEMLAVGNGDGTVSIQNMHQSFAEIFKAAFEDYIDEDEIQLGVSEAATVVAINLILLKDLEVPVITSALSATVLQNTPFSYTITASGPAFFFDASGLPLPLTVDHATGLMSGTAPTAADSPFLLKIAAGNGLGVDSEDFTLTINIVFVNTISTQFAGGSSQTCENSDLALVGAPNAPYTRSYWLKRTTAPSAGVAFWGDASSEEGWKLRFDSSGGGRYVIEGGDVAGGDWVRWTGAAGSTSINAWENWVFVYDGTSPLSAAGLTVYKNGVDVTGAGVTSFAGSYTPTAWPTTDTKFKLGMSNGGNYFTGFQDEASVWDTAMSASEVGELKTAGAPRELFLHSLWGTNEVAWWRMGDHPGDIHPTIRDQSPGVHDLTMINMTVIAFQPDVAP